MYEARKNSRGGARKSSYQSGNLEKPIRTGEAIAREIVGNTNERNADGTFGGNQLDQNDPIGGKPHS